ncbi:MAG TPA: hypothetical protein VJZ00_20220 [Thermoanaerobaculia bacterium]|nr:hypothetical protein [Thermoanaerobaculia bacterium]
MSTLDRTTRIRSIFLKRKRRYSLADISRLAGITERKVITGIEAGEYLASRRRGEYRFTWSELAHIAMAKWPLPIIHDALGADAALALPPLLLLQDLQVRLPAYQVLMLHRLAELARVDVNSYLANYFLDLAGSEVSILDAEIPGFKAAMRFPNGDGR